MEFIDCKVKIKQRKLRHCIEYRKNYTVEVETKIVSTHVESHEMEIGIHLVSSK